MFGKKKTEQADVDAGAAESAAIHVFDQTNGVLAATADDSSEDEADHAARNGLTAGGVTNLGRTGF